MHPCHIILSNHLINDTIFYYSNTLFTLVYIFLFKIVKVFSIVFLTTCITTLSTIFIINFVKEKPSSADDADFKISRRAVKAPRNLEISGGIIPEGEQFPKDAIQKEDGGECLRRSVRHSNDGRWFNYSSTTMILYAYTAILDDRASLLRSDRGVVRVIALASDWTGELPPLRCLLYLNGNRNVIVDIDKDVIKTRGYHNSKINTKLVHEYLFGCPLVHGEVPLAVAILTDPDDGLNTTKSCIAVELPMKPTHKSDFAICVPIAYNRMDAFRLIEWMELQRLLGVSMVGFYSFNLDNTTLSVLRHYAAESFVDLHTSNQISDTDDRQQVCSYLGGYLCSLSIASNEQD